MLDYRSSTLQPNDVIVDLSRHINKLLAYEDISDSSSSDLDMDEESHSDVDSDGFINSSSSENSV